MLQFVLEFATTKPSNVSPAEDLRPTSSSPTPTSLSEAISKDSRLSTRRTKDLYKTVAPDQRLINTQTSNLLMLSLFPSVNLETQIPLRAWFPVFPVASVPPYTSPSPSADSPLNAHHTQLPTASLKKSCTLLRPAYSVGGLKSRMT